MNTPDVMPEFGTSVVTPIDQAATPSPCAPTVQGERPKPMFVSWTGLSGAFIPSGAHVDRIPAGIFEYRYDEQIQAWAFRSIPVNTDALMVLPEPQYEYILEEHRRFWRLRQRFHDYGFVHKRGLLLWGPAGSGKTCLVALLCQRLISEGGIVLSVQDPSAGIAGLHILRMIEPNRPVTAILEDIDAIIPRFGEHQLLSLLDGEMQMDHVTFLATTNYPERLDKRIVDRPSRFDRIIYMGMPKAESRRLYLQSKDPSLSPDDLNRWVELSEGYGLAHLREMVVASRVLGQPIEEVVERLTKMHKRQPTSDEASGRVGFSAKESR